MARSVRDSKIDSRTARLKLTHRVNPYWASLGPGQALGYYRPRGKASGTWIARYLDPDSRKEARQKLATADDYAEADGTLVLTFDQAQKAARTWFDHAREAATGEKVHRGPFTVADAMSVYLDHMDSEGKASAGDARRRTELHILPNLGSVEVVKLTRLRLEKWRDGLAASPRLAKQSKRPAPKRPRKPRIEEKPAPKPPKTGEEKRAFA